jgi:predicted nucleic acid-binding protein
MILIADSSALIALSISDALWMLEKLFATVRVPRAVLEEVTTPGKAESVKLAQYLSDKVVDIDLSDYILAEVSLDMGELQAMALYKNSRQISCW